MMYRSTAQSFPFLDDGPDSFSQSYDSIARSEDAALSRFSQTVRNTAFAPVLGVNIFLRHQPT